MAKIENCIFEWSFAKKHTHNQNCVSILTRPKIFDALNTQPGFVIAIQFKENSVVHFSISI